MQKKKCVVHTLGRKLLLSERFCKVYKLYKLSFDTKSLTVAALCLFYLFLFVFDKLFFNNLHLFLYHVASEFKIIMI